MGRKDESDDDVIHDEDGAGGSSDEGLVTEAYPESVFAMSNKGMCWMDSFV